MKPVFYLLSLFLFAGFGFGQTSVVYTVDSTRSTVTVNGSFIGTPFMAQGAGSLTTSFTGAIDATLNSDTGNATQVLFPSSGIVSAEDSGSWAPLASGEDGSEPANYGLMVNGPIPAGIVIPSNTIPAGVTLTGFQAETALRNLELTVGSSVLPIDPIGGIPGTQLVANVVTGDVAVSVDVLASAFGFPLTYPVTNFTFAITNTVTTNNNPSSSITQSNGIETLVIELDNLLQFTAVTTNDSFFRLQGQLVATRMLPVPPNRAPVLGPVPDQFVAAGTILGFAFMAGEADVGQTLSYTASGPGVSISTNVVTISTTPADAFTILPISVTVTDDGSPPLSDTETFQVHVAGEPVITNIVSTATARDIAFESMAGFTYDLEMAPQLSTNDTFTLLGSTTATNGFGVLTETAPCVPLQFYRVRIQP